MADPATRETARRKLFIRTYGCQMNVYDSGRMADVLAPLGYAEAPAPEEADMVILNTCHIREKASEKVFSDLGRLKTLKRHKQNAGEEFLIAVAGCVAQAEGAEIMARAPFVDIVLGPQTYHRLPQLIAAARAQGRAIDTDFPPEPKFDALPAPRQAPGEKTAFLSVQEGCDKFCTFCVVPYTRGAEYSRPAADVLAEARALVAGGAREITLLGQNVNAYHGAADDGANGGGIWGLGRLARALAEIAGLARIRYTTSHPRDMDEELIAAHGDVAQLMPFLHLPVQCGSDRILAAMNRGHTRADYLRIVARLRERRPDIALSSDFIVGFPGETERDFAETLSLAETVGFVQAYAFKFSARPGTPAAAMAEQLPEAEKAARLAALQEVLVRHTQAFNLACVGRRLEILVTGPGRRPGQMAGRSPYLQPVHMPAEPSLIGSLVTVEIIAADANSMAAKMANS